MHHHRLKREILVLRDPTGLKLRIEGNKIKWGCYRGGIFHLDLPEGNWRILSKGNEITGKQAEELMEYANELCGFIDFEDNDNISFHTALESFQSFLKSNNYTPEKVVILVTK